MSRIIGIHKNEAFDYDESYSIALRIDEIGCDTAE